MNEKNSAWPKKEKNKTIFLNVIQSSETIYRMTQDFGIIYKNVFQIALMIQGYPRIITAIRSKLYFVLNAVVVYGNKEIAYLYSTYMLFPPV